MLKPLTGPHQVLLNACAEANAPEIMDIFTAVQRKHRHTQRCFLSARSSECRHPHTRSAGRGRLALVFKWHFPSSFTRPPLNTLCLRCCEQ